ncbi:hypothetical protein MOX02_61920 [Methylobacterium oxalidis]|uniref:Uncharacterized protein n=1 Tax=Methylobacterium oxalidis TaxID=944322 RepID=A0A512JDX0_9HYPH|nr:hypothetical protein [Methylobacterium oxalidis]GEP08154.1 hypothetical protein MOX02_61920 [Methylobacterium oxalidis]
MLHNAEVEFARYLYAVYPPPMPWMPWLSVCIAPDGHVLDSEAFATFEEADLVTYRAQAVLFDSLVQQVEIKHALAADGALH